MKKVLKNWGVPIAVAFVVFLVLNNFVVAKAISSSDFMNDYPKDTTFFINKLAKNFNVSDVVVVEINNEHLIREISSIEGDVVTLSNDINSETVTTNTSNIIGKAFNF